MIWLSPGHHGSASKNRQSQPGVDQSSRRPACSASRIHDTQRETEQSVKNTVANLGGGEVRIQRRAG